MNKFKSLLLFCMVFAFAAFPLSNQGFCNGDPISVDFDLADCTTTIGATTQDCAVDNTTYTLNVPVSTTNAETVSVTVTGTAGTTYGPVTLNGTYAAGSVTVSFANIPDGTTGLSISATSSGSNCGTPASPTTATATHTSCVSACQTCFTGDATIEDANGATEGGEVCGPVDEAFYVGNDLTSNGTIGSAANRTVVYYFGNTATLNAGTEFFLGSDVTIVPLTFTTCSGGVGSLAEDNAEVSIAAPVVTTELKISPNPVTNMAKIQYNMAVEGRVQVSVFDMKGNRVAVIANEVQNTGMQTLEFNSSNLSGGFYYLTVQTANSQTTERMVIVK